MIEPRIELEPEWAVVDGQFVTRDGESVMMAATPELAHELAALLSGGGRPRGEAECRYTSCSEPAVFL